MQTAAEKLPDKETVARTLADAHFTVDSGTMRIFRVLGSKKREALAEEPIKLLEVNRDTFPAGIMPICFGPHTPSGISYPSVIIEITPQEFNDLKQSKLKLPRGWNLGPELRKKRRGK